MAEYLQRVPLEVSIGGIHSANYLHQDAGKTYSEISNTYEIILEVFKSNHLQAYKKEYWRLSGYKRIIRDDHQNCLFDKREISYDKASACL